MRFILVQVQWPALFPGKEWRATSETDDIFFSAPDVDAARAHVRQRYPNATFTDQEQDHAV
jgi:hypothetical protein